MRLGRYISLMGFAVAVFATGCHRAKDVPIAATAPSPPVGARSSAPVARVPAPIERAPAAVEEVHGKPVMTEIGLASWYGTPYKGRKAADGSVFDENAMTAAHRELPIGTIARVTNLQTNQSVLVKITDRGPFVPGRTLDLSMGAAKAIGLYRSGVAKVKVEAYALPGADPGGRWCVQIGAFVDADDAVQLKNELLSKYKGAKVIQFPGPTGYWVRINPASADKATATRIADGIHVPDGDAYLIRTN